MVRRRGGYLALEGYSARLEVGFFAVDAAFVRAASDIGAQLACDQSRTTSFQFRDRVCGPTLCLFKDSLGGLLRGLARKIRILYDQYAIY